MATGEMRRDHVLPRDGRGADSTASCAHPRSSRRRGLDRDGIPDADIAAIGWIKGLQRRRFYPLYLLGYSTMDRVHQLRGPVWHLFTVTLVGALVFANALAYLVERRALRALRH